MSHIEDNEILNDFIEESLDHLDGIEDDLLVGGSGGLADVNAGRRGGAVIVQHRTHDDELEVRRLVREVHGHLPVRGRVEAIVGLRSGGGIPGADVVVEVHGGSDAGARDRAAAGHDRRR